MLVYNLMLLGYSYMVMPTFCRLAMIKLILLDYFTRWLAMLKIVIVFNPDDWIIVQGISMAIVIKVSVQLSKSKEICG